MSLYQDKSKHFVNIFYINMLFFLLFELIKCHFNKQTINSQKQKLFNKYIIQIAKALFLIYFKYKSPFFTYIILLHNMQNKKIYFTVIII